MSDIQRDMRSLDYGWDGFKVVSAGETVDFDDSADGFYAIKAIEGSAVIDATAYKGDNLTNTNMLAGDMILGLFSSVTCDTGKVLVYMR